MGKSMRDYRKSNKRELLSVLDFITTKGYKVTFMGKTQVVEREFDTLSDAKRFAHSINSAGCMIEPIG